jgi:hypothetical protein
VHDYCKRHDIEWKRVAVTEYENRRIHHHVVCSGIDREIIESRWKYGHVNFRELYSKGCYHELADYLVKETEKTFRLEDAVNKQRYGHTRNLVMPVIKQEEISLTDMTKDPKPIKGYYIPKDRVRTFQHPVTGFMHRVWIELPLASPRRYKVWPRGKRVALRENYKPDYTESQVSFEWGER